MIPFCRTWGSISTCSKYEPRQIFCNHMEEASNAVTCVFGDRNTSDIIVSLRNRDGGQDLFYCHSSVLIRKSKFFADQLTESNKCIVVSCPGSEYEHHVKLLKVLYISQDLVLDSWDSVKSALGVLRASVALQCETITQSCIEYLEAVPWDEKEEEEILRIAPNLGPAAKGILARIQPVELNVTKNVFISAVRFATTIDMSFPPFGDELKTSAQEQVEYMLVDDDDTPLVVVDRDVRSEVKAGLTKMFTTFEKSLSMLSSDFDHSSEVAEQRVLQSLSDLEWMCNVLPKLEMLKEFVVGWAYISDHMLAAVQEERYSSGLWAVKTKLMEVAGKVMEAIGYGNVVIPAPTRTQFLKTWLPYMRRMKVILDSKSANDEAFPHKMDGDLCQSIEGAIVSLVLALPSNDQAEILGDWMKRTEQLKFPDLSEAFEVWCYRTKSAKRRLAVGLNGTGNPTVKLQ